MNPVQTQRAAFIRLTALGVALLALTAAGLALHIPGLGVVGTDARLAFFVGLALGLTLVVPAMLVMAISGGLAAAILLATRLRGKGDPIPYAPFIAGGMLVAMLLSGTAFTRL